MADSLELKGLMKSYGSFRLDHIDLTCPEGTITGLVGPNGAGKTLCLSM
jgi:ABC-2 type transport system ATP-binding protein